MNAQDTIAACATAYGRAGIGIIRVSGPNACTIAKQLTKKNPNPRQACFTDFIDSQGEVIDQGLLLFFPGPHSFTGEDVIEFQGHGGPVVLDCLLNEILQQGARAANPGEFSLRAYLNNKIDLAQAEAIADLIDSGSSQAAKAAMNSLQGEFSRKISLLVDALIKLRMYVEAAIDFPEEEIDFLSDGHVASQLNAIISDVEAVQREATQGRLLREGMNVVIVGKPNAGKSSLLNCLSGQDSAIVTDIPGTTRDILREYIQIDGLPLHIIDTAGLRESPDVIEQEGIRRAYLEISKADRILLIVDSQEQSDIDAIEQALLKPFESILQDKPYTIIFNKIDLIGRTPQIEQQNEKTLIYLSAKTRDGIQLLTQHLKQSMGFESNQEGCFMARRRHLVAIASAHQALLNGKLQLAENKAGELLAEDLRQAQHALSEITGEFTSDDLLGEIFSSFCIGK